MSFYKIFEPIDDTVRYWTGIKLKTLPKEYDYSGCRGRGLECYQEGLQEENLQWDNFFIFIVFNLIVSSFGTYISLLCWFLAAVLYFFPGYAITPSNKLDQDMVNSSYRGIPF